VVSVCLCLQGLEGAQDCQACSGRKGTSRSASKTCERGVCVRARALFPDVVSVLNLSLADVAQFADRTKGVATIKARILRETEEQRERERLFEEQKLQLLRQASANKKKAASSPAASPTAVLVSAAGSEAFASVGSTASLLITSGGADSGTSSPTASQRGDAGGTYESEFAGPGEATVLSDVTMELPVEPSLTHTPHERSVQAASVIQVPLCLCLWTRIVELGHVLLNSVALQATWRHWQHQRKTARLVADLAAVEHQQAVLHEEAAVKILSILHVAVAKKRLREAKRQRHEVILARLRAAAVPAEVPSQQPPVGPQFSPTSQQQPLSTQQQTSSGCCVIL
jgi:hypothetical protein